MKASIEVASRSEADLIRKGLEDPLTRALVQVIGALEALPSDRARRLALLFVKDHFDEEAE